ncbi:two-component sensor histidine kinase [Paractinoplanes rishiriensis]|uniref:histidine kinase n=1 Tax=Paractinoplanes rishiriensis TaxID=1050105 RepID=A0A919JUD8_9ACTN|nr:two-component sensor histidine kinase [Actinoplanes rishiriensis]
MRPWFLDLCFLPFIAWMNLVPDDGWGPQSDGLVPAWVVTALGVAPTAVLALRRRWPGTVFVVQVVWSCAAVTLVDWSVPVFALALALVEVAGRRSLAWLFGALGGCLLVSALFAVQPQYGFPPDGGWSNAAFGTAMFTALAGMLGAFAYYQPRHAGRRERALISRALQDERLVIARELHDIVSHSVGVMMLQAAGARAVLDTDPQRVARPLEVIQDVGAQSMDELRRLLHLLRAADDDADRDTRQPGFESIAALVEQSRAVGLRVEMLVDGEPGRLDPSVSLTAYRLVQEALTNTRKHAGERAHATVRINWHPSSLRLAVEDTGPGAQAVHSTGHGLLGLRERVATVGGEMRAEPTAGGFLVEATLPVTQRASSVTLDSRTTVTRI